MIWSTTTITSIPGSKRRRFSAQSLATFYARLALATAFLSGIASRFGLVREKRRYGNFANFVQYTAQVNAFMPAFKILFLAWAATLAEFVLGVFLLAGFWPRWTPSESALLLAIFGCAMAISMGIKITP